MIRGSGKTTMKINVSFLRGGTRERGENHPETLFFCFVGNAMTIES